MDSAYKIANSNDGFWVIDSITDEPISGDIHILRQDASLEAIAYILNNVLEISADGDPLIALDTASDIEDFIDPKYFP